LGNMYSDGKGVPQNYAKAVEWYRKAAKQGYVRSQNLLGFMYELGKGVPQNYIVAYKWVNIAATSGDKTAINSRDRLLKEMTPEQIAEGQRLSSEFVAKKSK